ncbi:amidohydrolase [Halioglobus pacificus]|uniref:Amidohydrolase n=1 Tax=Parahalioglobus pacificus TaxID=930806 RepID=A0A918XIG3_9GAMM|nr:amidohydrolase family protein [Halioglobus pacificus]GHD32146.1 amidohydrolase [Halioglobus pacificus]
MHLFSPRSPLLPIALLSLWPTALLATELDRHTTQRIDVDLVIENARVFTANPQSPWAEAIAIDEGRFVYVGGREGLATFTTTQRVDLEEQLIIPGLVDGHAHPGYVNVENFGEVEGDTPEALLASVKVYAERHPEQQWLRLCCWPTAMFVDGEDGPDKAMLDAVVPDRLVWFESETAHDFWLNSKALQALGVTAATPDPKPGVAAYARNSSGEPTGWVKEGAGVQHFATQFALTDPEHRERHKDSVAEILQVFSRHGVTAIYDAGNKGFGEHVYSVIADLEREGRLPLRYYGTYQIYTPDRAKTAIAEVKRYRREYGSDKVRFNSVKVFMDGISANQSAAYLKPYVGSTAESQTLLSEEELTDLLLQLHDEKLDLMVHSIGDKATRTVLDAVEAAKAAITDSFYPRVTVAHLALVDPADLERIEELGVIANFTPWWFGAEPNDIVEKLLGASRYSQMYRARSVFDSGATVTFSSDEWWGGDMLPTYVSPYLGMQVGHTRQYPKSWWSSDDDGIRPPEDERLQLEQLLLGYTRHGAFQLRLEDVLGEITPGKIADFVVLPENLFKVNPYEIWQLQPSAVVFEGEVIQGAMP